jgi:hypothetical protein
MEKSAEKLGSFAQRRRPAKIPFSGRAKQNPGKWVPPLVKDSFTADT